MKYLISLLMLIMIGCATSPLPVQPIIDSGETTIIAPPSTLSQSERAALEQELEDKIHVLADIPMIREKILKKKAQIDALVAQQPPDNSPPGSFKPLNIPKRKQTMILLVLRGIELAQAEYQHRVEEIRILLGRNQ